jgi:putative phage-type endonuclease
MIMKTYSILSIEQGSPEWLSLRKTKITATDAPIIMGANPWKNKRQLFEEKLSPFILDTKNQKMQRGIDLEPIARNFFIFMKSVNVFPQVLVKEWAMASLDGLSKCGNYMVEIKCPGTHAHSQAVNGIIPEYYFPQLQHQLFVADLDKMFYLSFDGEEGIIIEVKRDDSYIMRMIEEERKFFDCLIKQEFIN